MWTLLSKGRWHSIISSHVKKSNDAPAVCCLLIHVGLRRSQLALSHGLHRSVWRGLDLLPGAGNMHPTVCVRTLESWRLPPVSQPCPNMVRMINMTHVSLQAFFRTFPPSQLLLETQSRGAGSSHSSPTEKFSPRTPARSYKSSTCLVRKSSRQAL